MPQAPSLPQILVPLAILLAAAGVLMLAVLGVLMPWFVYRIKVYVKLIHEQLEATASPASAAPPRVPIFDVTGADRETGERRREVYEVADEEAALAAANHQGILVESIRPRR